MKILHIIHANAVLIHNQILTYSTCIQPYVHLNYCPYINIIRVCLCSHHACTILLPTTFAR